MATNDVHYTRAEDPHANEFLLCVQSGKTLADPNRFKFAATDFYLKSSEDMRRLWAELPEACDNTLGIAEACEVGFVEATASYMPRFGVPTGEDETSWFIKEVERGRHRRAQRGGAGEGRRAARLGWASGSLQAAATKGGEKAMSRRLANELMEATEGRGGAMKKRDEVHRMAEANKAFSHFRF